MRRQKLNLQHAATTAAVAVARAAANREATTKVPVQHSKKAATTDAAPNFTNS